MALKPQADNYGADRLYVQVTGAGRGEARLRVISREVTR
jgi:hypothetical protein